jgi:phage virion morphogenesis protein
MTDKLKIDLVNADAITGPLQRALARLARPRDLLQSIGAELEANVNLRFETKTDASGAPWSPIKPITAEIWAAMHDGQSLPGSLLERTRLMRNSLAANATDDYVEVGFSAPYAGYHVTGTRKMVRRDPLFATVNMDLSQGTLGAQDEADVLAVIDAALGADLA